MSLVRREGREEGRAGGAIDTLWLGWIWIWSQIGLGSVRNWSGFLMNVVYVWSGFGGTWFLVWSEYCLDIASDEGLLF